jgi:hypothetical protein
MLKDQAVDLLGLGLNFMFEKEEIQINLQLL